MGEQIRIGQIVSTQGLKGEVRVYPLTDYKERFEELEYVNLEESSVSVALEIEKIRYKGKLIILKFKGLDSINDVDKLKDKYIVIDKDEVRDLPDDTYYIFDLIGSKIVDEKNTHIGNLVDVMQNTAQDIYVVEYKGSKKKFFIPVVKEFIREVNIEEKIIKVKLIEGMIE
ncbi:ribosome maturation factor RimM [Wukongibacter sp. M2B1]|uniref:ribosome maturation factor RimM n=1 Tax=Wukongibacter sp. M2B1 TaxID=3088895 RepID=UPI003D7999F6